MILKDYSTSELLAELEKRDGITKIAVGPYQNYRLEAKYESNGTREIVSDTVLVLSN